MIVRNAACCALVISLFWTGCSLRSSGTDGSDIVSDSNEGADSGSESESDSELGSNSVSDAGNDTGSGVDTESESESDTGSGGDTGGDTAEHSDGDSDSGDGPGVGSCTVETVLNDCGAASFCVEGHCCNESCSGECQSCAIPGNEGTCSYWAKDHICRAATGDCDVAETCMGNSAVCPEDIVHLPTHVCRQVDSTKPCDVPEFCDGVIKSCPSDETAADETPCGAATEQFRCGTDLSENSIVDCTAQPQHRTQSNWCISGECVAKTNEEWVTITECEADGICESDNLSFAECVPCDLSPGAVCEGESAITFNTTGACSMDSGAPVCQYSTTEIDCTLEEMGCVMGLCTPYTCAPGEKDYKVNWETGEAEGWELNNWAITTDWPWMETYHSSILETTLYTEEETYMISPVHKLFGCSRGEASFYLTFQDEFYSCVPRASIQLECGFGEEWTPVWSLEEPMDQGFTALDANKGACLYENIDISQCMGLPEVQFRFSVANTCDDGLSSVLVDDFSFVAVNE